MLIAVHILALAGAADAAGAAGVVTLAAVPRVGVEVEAGGAAASVARNRRVDAHLGVDLTAGAAHAGDEAVVIAASPSSSSRATFGLEACPQLGPPAVQCYVLGRAGAAGSRR